MLFILLNIIWLLACFNNGEFKTIPCPIKDNPGCICKDENGIKEIDCFKIGLSKIPIFVQNGQSYDLLKIEKNSITTIQSDAFNNLRVAEILINEERLNSIDNNAFANLPDLKKLQIIVSNVQFSKDVFNIISLTDLILSGFTIQNGQLPDKALNDLPNLRNLKLENFGLKSIREGELPINYKTALEKLSLINNKLTDFAIYGKAGNLKELYLKGNEISRIESNSLTNLRRLEILDLTENRITNVAAGSFDALVNLQRLVLVDTTFSTNQLTEISKLKNLRELDLSGNKGLNSLKDNLFIEVTKLRKLFLSNCDIKELKFKHLKGTEGSLIELRMDDNKKLNSIEKETFGRHSKIEILSFQKCNLAGSLTEAHFESIKLSLKELNFKDTPLLPKDLRMVKPLISLEKIILENIDVGEIEDNLFLNSQVKELSLKNNPLKKVNQNTFAGLSDTLAILHLEQTQVSTISSCVFRNFNKLDHLSLSSLDCDCRLKWLHRWVRNHNDPIYGLWTCKSPTSLVGQMFRDLEENDLVCSGGIEEDKCEPIVIPSTLSPNQSAFNRFNLTKLNDSNLKAKWILGSLYEPSSIESFAIDYSSITKVKEQSTEKENIGAKIEIKPIEPDKREQIIENLKENTEYVVCIQLKIKGKDEYSNKMCASAITSSGKQISNSSSSAVSIALGVVFGILAVILIIALIVFILYKKRFSKKNDQHTYDKPITESNPDIPRLGRDSKRYAKSPRSKSTANSTTNLIPSISSISQYPHSMLDDLTPFERDRIISILSRPESVASSQYHLMSPDERDRLINKLTHSGVSGYSGFSSHSRDSGVTMNTSGATGPKLPPRPPNLEGYLNPLEMMYDPKLYTEENIYCEISNPKNDSKSPPPPQDNYEATVFKESYI
ncbi:DgyrCDS11271 [Dimorphilus gyrociliatus]|uniref:DgyrCDS11271 n=1 Tax=Dimorphilus gyrociliatus TaxID=2664684 RepID=A0A7I8W2S1_9ANNE|nr:DgyrCDS11271 [Dimorphilus gyrociliatus]